MLTVAFNSTAVLPTPVLPTPVLTPTSEELPSLKRPTFDTTAESVRSSKRPRAIEQFNDKELHTSPQAENPSIPTTWLVTGASRGLGFAFVEFLSRDPRNVVLATCRDPSGASQLQSLAAGRVTPIAAQASALAKSSGEESVNKQEQEARKCGELHILRLDVEDEASINEVASEATRILSLRKLGLDYLLNNAGIVRFSFAPESTCFDGFHFLYMFNLGIWNNHRMRAMTRHLLSRCLSFYAQCARMLQAPPSFQPRYYRYCVLVQQHLPKRAVFGSIHTLHQKRCRDKV